MHAKIEFSSSITQAHLIYPTFIKNNCEHA